MAVTRCASPNLDAMLRATADTRPFRRSQRKQVEYETCSSAFERECGRTSFEAVASGVCVKLQAQCNPFHESIPSGPVWSSLAARGRCVHKRFQIDGRTRPPRKPKWQRRQRVPSASVSATIDVCCSLR